MKKVYIVHAPTYYEVEEGVNKFIEDNKDEIEIIDIQYQTTVKSNYGAIEPRCSVLIVYETNE